MNCKITKKDIEEFPFKETIAGISLTEKQIKNLIHFTRLMKEWDKDLCINVIAGKLHIMLLGDTDQNSIPEISNNGGFNRDNNIVEYLDVIADGGDW